MNVEFKEIVALFIKVFNKYCFVEKIPKDLGAGDLLYATEAHTIRVVGENPEINLTQLANLMGVSKGAISQTVKRLERKKYIAKYSHSNEKDIKLRLSDKGYIISKAHEELHYNTFRKYESLFMAASNKELKLVKKMLYLIYNELDEYAKNLGYQ